MHPRGVLAKNSVPLIETRVYYGNLLGTGAIGTLINNYAYTCIMYLYSHTDRTLLKEVFMVGDTLTPYLEEVDHGFKLIFHERDFPGGWTIMANIINAIKSTRKMIMLLTK